MTLEEAQKVAAILAKADGGCSNCYNDLMESAQEAFPAFEWTSTSRGPDVQGRADWEALWAAWDAAWPPGSVDEHGQPCPIRVRPRPP